MSERRGYCYTCNNTGEVDCYCGGDLCVCGGDTGYGTNICPECDGKPDDGFDDIDDGIFASDGEWER